MPHALFPSLTNSCHDPEIRLLVEVASAGADASDEVGATSLVIPVGEC